MAVIINTNYSATVAANNLADSSQRLQSSLNRLSSGSKIVNPSDDAGGLAVSMKLSAAAKRQGAVSSNVANAISLLQTQDSVLGVTGKILNRISELKVLDSDVTKSASDRANYQAEFAALQAQIVAQGGEAFNGVALFGSNSMSVGVSEDGQTSVNLQGVELLGTPGFAPYNAAFNDLSEWTPGGGTPSAAGGVLTLGNFEDVTSNASYEGPFEISMEVDFSGVLNDIVVEFGGVQVAQNFNTGVHTLKIVVDGNGNASSFLDGSTTAFQTASGVPTGAQQINLFGGGGIGGVTVQDFSVTSTSASGNVSSVSAASDLGSLTLSSITSAIEDVATFRAENGAGQSRLGFAAELVSVNKANLEAANSRILDVDVAAESTTLARYNVLVQAGTSMLAQANQSSQMALKLLQ